MPNANLPHDHGQGIEQELQNVSHHLRQLKAAGLLVSERSGKEVYYRAAETDRAQLLHHMIEQLVEIACPGHSAPGAK